MLVNNSLFKVKEIPSFHPVAQRYERTQWWKEQTRRSIEGYWVAGKWCPPELYYYINFHNIIFESSGGVSTSIGLPWMRDIEWEKAYVYTEACGFSGFEGDNRYTCHRAVTEGLTKEEVINLYCTDRATSTTIDKHYNNIFTEDGEFKEYIPAREYLRKEHFVNLGKPIYVNPAKNLLELGPRGYGKSYFTSGLIAHNFIFSGARDYDEFVQKRIDNKPFVSQSVVGSIDAKYSNDLLRKVRIGLENLPGKESIINNFGEAEDYPAPFFTETSGSLAPSRSLVSYTKSLITHVTFKDNPLAANGTRPNRVFLEECFAKGTKVRMADLSVKNIEEIKIGDRVLGADGKGKEVGRTVSGEDLMYKVSQKRGMDYTVNSKHLLYLEQRCNVKDITDDGIKLIRSEDFELIGKYRQRTTYGKFSGLINLENPYRQRLRIEPYYFGAWLGDGLSAGQGIVVNKDLDYEIYEYIKDYTKRLNLKLIERETANTVECKYDLKWVVPIKRHGRTNVIRTALRHYNVLNNKRIPEAYFRSSEQQRLELLAGLIDTDGSVSTNPKGTSKSYEIGVSKRKELVDDIAFLARTLGFDVHVNSKESTLGYNRKVIEPRTKYRISIKGEIWKIPCKVKRKKIKFWNKTNAINSTPIKVECIGEGRYYGITLKASKESDRLFLLEDNTVVHNCGFLDNIMQTWGALEATQQAAEGKRLVIYGLGTGGLTTAGAALYAQEVFNNPDDFNCLVFDDIWEDKGKIGFFLPATLTKNKFKRGENLISDEKAALISIEKDREKAKKSGNPTRLLTTIINDPLKPSEIFLRQEGVFFPVQELAEASAALKSNKIKLNATQRVELYEDGPNKVKWKYSDKPEIVDFPLRKAYEMDAAICLFERPKENADGFVFPNRYILSTDPVDDDGNDNIQRSLQSTLVLDTWTDRIVAEYTARTYLASEYYEQVRLLSIFYNGKNLYENNKKGMYAHFKMKHSLHLLAESPEILKSQDFVRQTGIGNKALGININSDRIKLFGIELILKWLDSPSYDNSEIKNLHTIRSRALYEELIKYSLDINADRVSALICLMIYRAELSDRITQSKTAQVKTIAEDGFWGRAYKGYNQQKVYNRLK